MLYLNKRSPSEELASVHNPNSPSGTSTWHHSLDDQKMTEVVAYPQPQHLYHFGGSSHRLLAPAPEQKSPYFSPDLYREMPVYPVGYQTTSHLARSPPEARSASVSSISSAASHGTPNMSSSRTMSPVADSNSSDSMASPPVLTRTYNPPSSYHHTQQQHHHTSQALPSSLIPAPSHYLHAQVAPPPPMSLYPSMPVPPQRTTTYPSSSSYGYHQHMGHPYPSQQPMHNYHQVPIHNYQPVYTYNTSAQTYPSLSAGTILPSFPGSSVMTLPQIQRHEKAPIERLLDGNRNIMQMIQSHLDYFDIIRAQMVNRFFKDHFDPSLCPEEDKIRCVMYAEINFKRFWPNNTSSGGRGGGDKDDGKHPGSFGCYHCFKVKNPENFELFRWKNDLEDAPDNNNNNSNNNSNNDRNSQRGSVSSAASSRQQQQQQQQPQNNPPLSPSTSSTSSHNTQFSLTSNPHYDPSVTRSSLAAAAAASSSRQSGNGGNNSNNGTRRTASTGYSSSDQSPRIQETWGIRRFCIDCGIKKKFYRPGVLIELHKEKNAVWVCDCWVTHKRPQELDCKVCKKILPLSTPNRRRS